MRRIVAVDIFQNLQMEQNMTNAALTLLRCIYKIMEILLNPINILKMKLEIVQPNIYSHFLSMCALSLYTELLHEISLSALFYTKG